jgi:hypothetical protein
VGVWDNATSTSFLHLMGDEDVVHYDNDNEDDDEDNEEEDNDNDNTTINCWQKLGRTI